MSFNRPISPQELSVFRGVNISPNVINNVPTTEVSKNYVTNTPIQYFIIGVPKHISSSCDLSVQCHLN